MRQAILLTREQLRKAIQSEGYLVGPHQNKYDLLVTAATDPYTQCGFRKLVCISHIEDFFIAHLPNKYVGELGVGLMSSRPNLTRWPKSNRVGGQTSLVATETKVRYLRWSEKLL